MVNFGSSDAVCRQGGADDETVGQMQVQNAAGAFEFLFDKHRLDRGERVVFVAGVDEVVGLNLLDRAVAIGRPEQRPRREVAVAEGLAGRY